MDNVNNKTTICHVEYGDYVRCNDCMSYMLVETATDICPNCGTEGCLMDIDDKENPRHFSEVPNPELYYLQK